MTDRYAVFGNPIGHSKSPLIHARFAEQTGQAIDYRAQLVENSERGFTQAVEQFRAGGGRGLNVTVPFKSMAWAYVGGRGQRSERAERAGAVNTLAFNDGGVFGDNTDGPGLVNDLVRNHGARLAGSRLLLLGAGGAARGVLAPLLAETPAALVIANRTSDKARALAKAFADLGPIQGCGLDDLSGQRFDLLINATAASLDNTVPRIPDTVLADGGWCYDMMYADEPTAFVRWGRARGAAESLDGLGMLIEQAAEAFYLWRGVRPQTAPVIAALRKTNSG